MHLFGENHILVSRLYINIGIVYEDNHDYEKAYDYFKKWAQVSEIVLGPSQPKTLRAKGVLRERRYRRIARQRGEAPDDDSDSENNGQNRSFCDNLDDVSFDDGGDLRQSSSESDGGHEGDDADVDYEGELYYGQVGADLADMDVGDYEVTSPEDCLLYTSPSPRD